MDIDLIETLKLAGFDESKSTKLVRHQDHRFPVTELRRRDWLELYQRYQSKPRFHDVKQLVAFYGLSGTRAGFYGVYTVDGHRSAQSGEILESCAWSRDWKRDSQYFYDLKRDDKFDDLRDRLIIDWGLATLSWVQKLSHKRVLEILEPGRKLRPFTDYMEFSLTYAELCDPFKNENAHRDWKSALSAVAGVYLILAEESGDQYIGSASGAEGIWGRWRSYAANQDGDNVKLRKLIDGNPNYPERFRFSVLHILPKTMTRDEVVQREMRYMLKLGTRATGLNS